MLTVIQRGNTEYLAHKQERKGRSPKITPTTQAVNVAPNVRLITSNPATFERHTGMKVDRPARKQGRKRAA